MKSLLILFPVSILASIVGISVFPIPKNPSLTVKYYKVPQKVSSHFYQNPFLNLPGPANVHHGTDELSVILPPERNIFVYEFVGFYKAPASHVSFRALNCKQAHVQFGYGRNRARTNVHDFEDIVSEEHMDILQWSREIQVTEGQIYPIRFVIVSHSKEIRLLDKIGDVVRKNIPSFVPAERVKLENGNVEWIAEKGKAGLFYRASVGPVDEELYDLAMQRFKHIPKMSYGIVDSSFAGAFVPKISVPYASEITGFIQVPMSGFYVFKLASNVLSALQIGLGRPEKVQTAKLGPPWGILDLRMGRKGKHLLRRGLFYPFRLVILGENKKSPFDMSIFDPVGKPIDLLGIWNDPTTSTTFHGRKNEATRYLDSTVENPHFRDASFGFIKAVDTELAQTNDLEMKNNA